MIAELVDIREVSVNKDLPKEQRVIAFVRRIRDPYHYSCDGITVLARFAPDGPALEDCLRRLMG